MKKNVFYIALGLFLIIFAAVEMAINDATFMPMLLFLGTLVLSIPSGFLDKEWRGVFSLKSSVSYEPVERESLFVARTFAGFSYIARNCGLLALADHIENHSYKNPIFKLGLNMIIDGFVPEYVENILKNMIRRIVDEKKFKVRYLKQSGYVFIFAGLFSGLVGSFALGFRFIKGFAINMESLFCLFIGTVVFIMIGLLFFFLITNKIENDAKKLEKIQRQIVVGLISIQCGDSYDAILRYQSSFLNQEEIGMLFENPLPLEFKNYKDIGDYDSAANIIRKSLRGSGIV